MALGYWFASFESMKDLDAPESRSVGTLILFSLNKKVLMMKACSEFELMYTTSPASRTASSISELLLVGSRPRFSGPTKLFPTPLPAPPVP